MANFERTKRLMEKLKGGGSKITDADLLMGFIKVGTDLGNVWATSQQDKAQTKMELALTGLSNSATALNYTDYQKEAPEGSSGDLYDYNRDTFITALESVEDTLKTPYIKETYGDAIDLAIRSNQAALAYQDTMRGQRATNITEMTELMENYTAMAQNDPLLTNPADYEEAKGIMQHLTDLRTHIEKQTGQQMISEHLVPLQKAQKEFQIISDLQQMDRDKVMDGIQANIQDEYSPYLKKWMEEKGIIATEVGEGMATLSLPEDDPDTPYVDESRIFIGVDDVDYTEARNAFKAWESGSLGIKTADYEIFDKVEQYAADPTQATIALLIGHGTWGNTENYPLENLLAFKKLSKKDKSIVTNAINDLEDRDSSGLYRAESNALQNKINGILAKAIRTDGKLGIANQDLANEIEYRGKALNEDIDLWNGKYTAAKDMDLPNIPVLVPDIATLNAVTDSKVSHLEFFENFIKKEMKDEGFLGDTALSADPTGNIRTLINNPDATLESKWGLMYNLTTEFLYAEGGRKRSGDVDDMFDGDTDRINLFYNTLKSFQKLMEAEPFGKPDLKNEIGVDLDRRSTMEKTTGLSGWSGVLLNM